MNAANGPELTTFEGADVSMTTEAALVGPPFRFLDLPGETRTYIYTLSLGLIAFLS